MVSCLVVISWALLLVVLPIFASSMIHSWVVDYVVRLVVY